jgi:hypothetical protein
MAARENYLSNPGNANLPIGVFNPANRQIGVPRKKLEDFDHGN